VDLAHLSRAPARFDETELSALSAKTLHAMPFGKVTERLAALGVAGPQAEAFWLAVRGNLEILADAESWWKIVSEPLPPSAEEPAFLAQAAATLPPEPWDRSTWTSWMEALKALSGRKGKGLFHPLRLALTGRENGPELASLLPLIGRDGVMARLSPGLSG
jgi:glutamyl-tRNA synthetase